jgi:cytochrome c peroxidase
MSRIVVPAVLALLLVPATALTGEEAPRDITTVGVHSLGPQRLASLAPVPVPPDNPQSTYKVHLGKQLYFDTRLSKDNAISCSTCHDPSKGWSDDGPTSVGIDGQRGTRRAPPVSNAAYFPLQFWDGRAPSLEEQSKGPIENPVEMGNSHEVMIETLDKISGYQDQFELVYGTAPITVDQVADAIAAFERTVVTTDSPFDRFVNGDVEALTSLERAGLEIFNGKGHCTACHWGAHFSDGRFHNLGVAQANPAKPDYGRYDVTKDPADKGAFKTPTVRDASLRAPYMHNGLEKTLEDVVLFYNRGGSPDANLDRLVVPLGLSDKEVKALVAFMSRAVTSINPEVADVKPIPASELPD